MEMKILHRNISEEEILFALVAEEVGEACTLSQRIKIIMNPGCSQELIIRPFTWLNLCGASDIIFVLFIIWLRMRASPTSSMTSSISISYSLILSCKKFTFILRNHHLQWSFIYMMRLGRCHYVIFVRFARYPSRAT